MLRKSQPADRPRTRRRSQDDEALGLEEGSQGSDDRRVVALVDPSAVVGLAAISNSKLDRSFLEPPDDVEARVREHPQHRHVLGQNDRDEPLDALAGRQGGQLSSNLVPIPRP